MKKGTPLLMPRYFVNTGDGIEYRDTEEEARKLADESIEFWREHARRYGEWSDEVETVCWGQMIETSKLKPCGETGADYLLKPTGVRKSLPNPVKQTTPTNCFQACVATILGLPIDEVPEACDGAKWDWDKFQDWLAGRGFQAIEITFENGGTIYPVRKPVPCIVTGNSPRECVTGRHAVVGELLGLEGFRLLHDPNPSEMWLDGEPTHAVFFVSI